MTCAPEEQDNDKPGQQSPVIAMPSYQSLPVSITAADSTPQMREYNDAAMKDPHGAEQNGLAHISVIAKLSTGEASIKRRKYTELDNGVCELFNRDWEFFPYLRFACAKILAGCLLLNNQNGQVIIANTIEVYGRTRLVDAHREPFIVLAPLMSTYITKANASVMAFVEEEFTPTP
ncbi:hypothetical protein KI688_008876 [Linnemannia hyalina]|uniref:Uncharacterized protein n=1 Tax=Linnemannia hyalina TaxID=64524 RepID=A0A9P7XG26_9FUNG|nr:hypothetical protein KI688_008876 [Linnemannia hyalina]